jgi:hypothetical protein
MDKVQFVLTLSTLDSAFSEMDLLGVVAEAMLSSYAFATLSDGEGTEAFSVDGGVFVASRWQRWASSITCEQRHLYFYGLYE